MRERRWEERERDKEIVGGGQREESDNREEREKKEKRERGETERKS